MSKLKSIELYGGGIKTQGGPDHIPSLDGFIIDENGNANFNSIKVREFFEVDELIYNKIKVSEDEQWITAAGKIETVEPYNINGSTMGYKVTFKADNPDTYIPPFSTNDILKGIFCNFQSEESPKLYVTHYFKVDSNDGSSIILEPYETSYLDTTIISQPYIEMVVVRIGNTHDKKRQKSILISAKNGTITFYDGVNEPKIKGENVKMLLGNIDPDNIDLPIPSWANIPGLKGYSAVMENVIIKGKFFQIPGDDLTADPQPLVTYEGIFDNSIKYYKNNTVTHEGNIYVLNVEHDKTLVAPYLTPDVDTSHWGLYLAKGKDGSIGKDGAAVIFKYGESYETSDWHEKFMPTDKYMQQFDIYDIKIGKPIQIVGEKGDGSDYFDFSFARTGLSNIDPSININSNEWQDAPPLHTTGKKFLWCKMQKMQWNESVEGNYIAVGKPTYTLMSAESYYNLNVTNDNCSINEIILEDNVKLREFTFNTIEFFKDGEIISDDYSITVINTNCETICDKLNKTIYVSKILNKNEAAYYELSVKSNESPTYTLKCTCNVVLNGKDGKVATVYELYPSLYTIRYNYDGTAPSSISFSIKVKKFNEISEILSTIESITNEKLKLQYSFNNSDWINITSLTNPINFINNIDKVYIKLLNSKDELIDLEEISIILNGAPGQKGESIKVKYSQTSDKTPLSNWHDVFDMNDIFMWQYNDITNQFIGEPIRIVGEKGDPGNGSDYIDFRFCRSASSTKVPSDIDDELWEDAPPIPEGDNKYLWCKMQKYSWNDIDSTHIISGDPTYTLLTAEEAETSYTLNMINDNCSVFNSLTTNTNELKDITYNTAELFYGLTDVDIFTLSISDMINCTAVIDTNNKKSVYVTSVVENERSFSYIVNAHVNNAIVSKCKCTGTIVSDASTIYELNTNISVLKYNEDKKYSGSSFDMNILKINYNSYTTITSNLSLEGLKINVKLYSNSDTASIDINSTTFSTLGSFNAEINSLLKSDVLYTSMEVKLYKENTIIDSETLPAVYDGEKGDIGVSIKVKYSSDNISWHDIFNTNDIWMKQYDSSTGEYIGEAIRIVGEKGEAADYIDYSFTRTPSNIIIPSNSDIIWEDAPMPSQNENRFLWCKMRKFIWDISTGTHIEVLNKYPQFILMTPEDPRNTYTLNMSNDNCSILSSHLTDESALRNLTMNNIELYYGNSIVNKNDYTLNLVVEESSNNITLNIDTNNNVYVSSIKGENVSEFYYTYQAVLNDNSIVSKCKCTGTILNENVLYQLCVNSSVLKFNAANEFTTPLSVSVYRIESNSYVEMNTTKLLNANSLKIGVDIQAEGDGPKGILWSDDNNEELTAFFEKVNNYINNYKLNYVYVYLSYKNADLNSYIDIEYIPAVSDGTPGPKGETGQAGKAIKVKYSSNKVNWHEVFSIGDIWMLQVDSLTDSSIGEIVKIVGEDGADGTLESYMDYSFTRTNSSTIIPDNINESLWKDAPYESTNEDTDFYLWNRIRKMIRQEDKSYIVDTSVAITYNLLTPEKPKYAYSIYATNDNCSIPEYYYNDNTQLVTLTGNFFEVFKGETLVTNTQSEIKIINQYNCTVSFNSSLQQYYISNIRNPKLPVYYTASYEINDVSVASVKCTCSVIPGNVTFDIISNINTLSYDKNGKYKGLDIILKIRKISNTVTDITSIVENNLIIKVEAKFKDDKNLGTMMFTDDTKFNLLDSMLNQTLTERFVEYFKISLYSSDMSILYAIQVLDCISDGLNGEKGNDASFYDMYLSGVSSMKIVNNKIYPSNLAIKINHTIGNEVISVDYCEEILHNSETVYSILLSFTYTENDVIKKFREVLNSTCAYLAETINIQKLYDNVLSYYKPTDFTLRLRVNGSTVCAKNIVLLKDGDPGNNGLPGALPRTFKWDAGETYVHNDTFCDYIFYDNYCYSIEKGQSVIGVVPNNGNTVNYPYKLESKQSFVATDTLLADEANLAGFVFKDNFLISQSGKIDRNESDDWKNDNFIPNLKFNGNTGEIEANKGKFNGSITIGKNSGIWGYGTEPGAGTGNIPIFYSGVTSDKSIPFNEKHAEAALDGNNDQEYGWNKSYFVVDNNGRIVANNASFSGEIEVGETAGIWGDILAPEGRQSCPRFYSGSSKDSKIFNAGDAADILEGFGPEYYNSWFVVDDKGLLTCNNVDISGKINATQGIIGGFEIGEKSIMSANKKLRIHGDSGAIYAETGKIGKLDITSYGIKGAIGSDIIINISSSRPSSPNPSGIISERMSASNIVVLTRRDAISLGNDNLSVQFPNIYLPNVAQIKSRFGGDGYMPGWGGNPEVFGNCAFELTIICVKNISESNSKGYYGFSLYKSDIPLYDNNQNQISYVNMREGDVVTLIFTPIGYFIKAIRS